MLLANGALYRAGKEAKIRSQLLKSGLLSAIVSLPGQLMTNTAIPVSLWIFKKGQSFKEILLIDASKPGCFESNNRQNNLLPGAVDKIVNTFKQRNEIPGFSRLVPVSEILANDSSLKVSRYVKEPESGQQQDLAAMKAHIEKLEKELRSVQRKMKQYLEQIELL